MFKNTTIIYCILLVLIIIVVASHGENIKNTENFMSFKADVLDIDKIKTTDLDKNMPCKFDMQCKSNECVKDAGGNFLCL